MSKNKKKRKRVIRRDDRKFVALLFLLAMSTVLGTVYYITKPTTPRSLPAAPAFGKLIETRPVLSPAMFIGDAAKAYRVASEIPKILDSLFCYCYCKKNHGHKTLLTCFTNNHGAKCDICIGEALYAYRLYKEGKSLDDIISAIDNHFYRPEPRKHL